MKKIFTLFTLAFVIIAACMIYLVLQGVSLRSAPIIKPSPIDSELNNVSDSLNIRLSPDFLESDYVLWGVLPENEEVKKIRQQTQTLFEKINSKQVTWATADDDLQECPSPCWVILKKGEAHVLSPNPLVDEILGPIGATHIGLSFSYFDRDLKVPAECEDQKRIEFECMTPLSVQEVRRKMKDEQSRLFFVRKYNHQDYFILLERASL